MIYRDKNIHKRLQKKKDGTQMITQKFYLALSVVLCTFVIIASPVLAGDQWLDTVVYFDRPTGSSNDGGPPENALGAPNGDFVSIDIPETLILAFTDNTAMDGIGDDLFIVQYIAGDSDCDIYGSMDNVTYVLLGQTDRDVTYDLSNYSGLDYVNYLKFVGLDNGGTYDGYDLDAVEALNSGPHIPEPATLSLLALGTAGMLLRRRKSQA